MASSNYNIPKTNNEEIDSDYGKVVNFYNEILNNESYINNLLSNFIVNGVSIAGNAYGTPKYSNLVFYFPTLLFFLDVRL